jgi:SAM-dependent methyltransferase
MIVRRDVQNATLPESSIVMLKLFVLIVASLSTTVAATDFTNQALTVPASQMVFSQPVIYPDHVKAFKYLLGLIDEEQLKGQPTRALVIGPDKLNIVDEFRRGGVIVFGMDTKLDRRALPYFVLGDTQLFPFRKAVFGAILTSDLSIKQTRQLASEIWRALETEGFFYIQNPSDKFHNWLRIYGFRRHVMKWGNFFIYRKGGEPSEQTRRAEAELMFQRAPVPKMIMMSALAPQPMCFASMNSDDQLNEPSHRDEAFYNRRVGLFKMLVSFAHKWAGNGNPDRVLVMGDEPILVDLIRYEGVQAFGMYQNFVESPHFIQALRAQIPFKATIFRVVFSMEPIYPEFTVTAKVIHQVDRVLRTGGFFVVDITDNDFIHQMLTARGYLRMPYKFVDAESEYSIFQKEKQDNKGFWVKKPLFYGDMRNLFKRQA